VSQQKVVTQQKPAAASKPRGDVQFIGAFLSGDFWRAHVVIQGTVYELSKGQRVAGMTVEDVTASSVRIGGHDYK
jgi:hypothetical protein